MNGVPRSNDGVNSGTLSVLLGLCCFSCLLVYVLITKISPESSANVGSAYESLKHQAQVNYEAFSHAHLSISQPKRYSLEWFDEIRGSPHDVHLVISSGCTGYQNWQCESLLYSWARIKHPGRITRIVSGCNSEEERQRAMKTGIPNQDERIQWYFTKDFAVDSSSDKDDSESKKKKSGGRKFVYFNKPFSMRQWIHSQRKKHAIFYQRLRNQEIDLTHTIKLNDTGLYESYIVLIDPDFIILRPFLFHMKDYVRRFCFERINTKEDYASGYNELTLDQCIKMMHLQRGHPISQKYGIGTKWIDWNVCPNSKCDGISEDYAWKHYSIGPPYMMHSDDWAAMVDDWVDYSPAALVKEPPPSILAEMFSFSIACAINDLPHELLYSMISDPGSGVHLESWTSVDSLLPRNIDDLHAMHTVFMDNSNSNSNNNNQQQQTVDGPSDGSNDNVVGDTSQSYVRWIDAGPIHIIHTCQGFWLGQTRNQGTIRLGGWNFHKGHVPQQILYDCDMPLLIQMSPDSQYSRNLISDEKKRIGVLKRLMKDEVLSDSELELISGFLLDSSFKSNAKKGSKNKFGFYLTDQKGTQSRSLNELLYQMVITPQRLYEMRDQSFSEGQIYKHIWFLTNVFANINEATINFRRKYCPSSWEPRYGLVLQQPESDRHGRRMNYFIHDYESGQSWTGH